MDRLHVFAARLLRLFRDRRADESLDAEIRSHLGLLIDENIRCGMKPEEAHYAARREFGGIEQTKEAYQEQRGLRSKAFSRRCKSGFGRLIRICHYKGKQH